MRDSNAIRNTEMDPESDGILQHRLTPYFSVQSNKTTISRVSLNVIFMVDQSLGVQNGAYYRPDIILYGTLARFSTEKYDESTPLYLEGGQQANVTLLGGN